MAAYVVVVLLIAFWPNTEVNNASINEIWSVLHGLGAPGWIPLRAIEFAANVLLFVPLSLLGGVIRPRWGWGWWLGAGFSGGVMIELGQLCFLSGRIPSVLDVTANTLGAALGYLLFTAARRV